MRHPARLALVLVAAVIALAIGSAQATAPAALPAGVTPGSPGDLTCNHKVNGADTIVLATHLAGLAASTPPGCPRVGDVASYANGKIAFASAAGDIVVMDANGANQVNLTNSPEWNDYPAWSPDGTKIAYTTYTGTPSKGRIYVMDANGDNSVPLTNSTNNDYYPSWSPDGQKIVFTSLSEDTSNDLVIMNFDGTGRHAITSDDETDSGAIWSPNGNRIAFTSSRSGSCCHPYLIDPDGDNIDPLVDTGNYESPTGWSPDGSRILLYIYDGDKANVFIVSAAGGLPVPLTDTDGRDTGGTFSPDGAFIAFNSRRDDPDPDNCAVCYQQIYTMTSTGQDPVRITDIPGENYGPSWQPVPDLFIGDLNCDGFINTDDLMVSLQDIAGLPLDLPFDCDAPG